MKFYPLAGQLLYADREALGIGHTLGAACSSRNVMAIKAGEYRAPKAGEWYLSGALVEAWRAPNDLSTNFHIVKLVKVRTQIILDK